MLLTRDKKPNRKRPSTWRQRVVAAPPATKERSPKIRVLHYTNDGVVFVFTIIFAIGEMGRRQCGTRTNAATVKANSGLSDGESGRSNSARSSARRTIRRARPPTLRLGEDGSPIFHKMSVAVSLPIGASGHAAPGHANGAVSAGRASKPV